MPPSRTPPRATDDALPPIPSAYDAPLTGAAPARPRVLDVVYAPRSTPARGTPAARPAPTPAPPEGPTRIAARIPWAHLRIVGMLRPPTVVQTGEAAPIFALDAEACRVHGLPDHTLVAGRPSFGLYDTEGNLAESLQVTGLWRHGTRPPGEMFVETAPQAALAAATDPTWRPAPTHGRFLAVLRADVWTALRGLRVSPPWRFYRVESGVGYPTLWVAAVDILAFRRWRRETAWRLLASVRGIIRDGVARGGMLDKTPGSAAHLRGCTATSAASTAYFRVTRLAFALAPQRSPDRTTMRCLFAMLARTPAERHIRMAPVRARSTDPEALVRFAEAWLLREDEGAPDLTELPADVPVVRADAAVPDGLDDDRPDNTCDSE